MESTRLRHDVVMCPTNVQRNAITGLKKPCISGLAYTKLKENDVNSRSAIRNPILATIVVSYLFFAIPTFAADIKGQVLGAGMPVAQSTVTLWAGSAGPPKQLAQTKTDKRWQVRDSWPRHA